MVWLIFGADSPPFARLASASVCQPGLDCTVRASVRTCDDNGHDGHEDGHPEGLMLGWGRQVVGW